MFFCCAGHCRIPVLDFLKEGEKDVGASGELLEPDGHVAVGVQELFASGLRHSPELGEELVDVGAEADDSFKEAGLAIREPLAWLESHAESQEKWTHGHVAFIGLGLDDCLLVFGRLERHVARAALLGLKKLLALLVFGSVIWTFFLHYK